MGRQAEGEKRPGARMSRVCRQKFDLLPAPPDKGSGHSGLIIVIISSLSLSLSLSFSLFLSPRTGCRAPQAETIRTVIDQRRAPDPPERVENNIDRRVNVPSIRFHVALTNLKYLGLVLFSLTPCTMVAAYGAYRMIDRFKNNRSLRLTFKRRSTVFPCL